VAKDRAAQQNGSVTGSGVGWRDRRTLALFADAARLSILLCCAPRLPPNPLSSALFRAPSPPIPLCSASCGGVPCGEGGRFVWGAFHARDERSIQGRSVRKERGVLYESVSCGRWMDPRCIRMTPRSKCLGH
jgi:hypothetical protein